MQAAILRWFEQIVDFATSSRPERTVIEAPALDMLQLVDQARQEWINSDRYFECVTDPELVDHAILLKDAAQKKYMYLLKLARAEGLRAYSAEQLADIAQVETEAPSEPAAVGTRVSCE